MFGVEGGGEGKGKGEEIFRPGRLAFGREGGWEAGWLEGLGVVGGGCGGFEEGGGGSGRWGIGWGNWLGESRGVLGRIG